jgi:hypothetical protein
MLTNATLSMQWQSVGTRGHTARKGGRNGGTGNFGCWGAQISGAGDQWRMIFFLLLCLMFLFNRYRTCFMPPKFWRLEI